MIIFIFSLPDFNQISLVEFELFRLLRSKNILFCFSGKLYLGLFALFFHQREFFEEGVAKLKPLTMTQIADIIGVHETTVSRALANKYIKTPHGVFEMKFFFTSGYQSEAGESVANTSVKEMIADIIAGEDPGKPLSDQEIVGLLNNKGLKIARRTVAKYREELGLLPSNLRRRYD